MNICYFLGKVLNILYLLFYLVMNISNLGIWMWNWSCIIYFFISCAIVFFYIIIFLYVKWGKNFFV